VDDEGRWTDVAGRPSVHSRAGRDQRASTSDGRRLRRSPVRLRCLRAAKDLPHARWRSQLAAAPLRLSPQRIPGRSCLRQSTRGLRFVRRAGRHSDAAPVVPLHAQRRHELASPPGKDRKRPRSASGSTNSADSVRLRLAARDLPAGRAEVALHRRHRFGAGDELALHARWIRAPAPARPPPDGRRRSSVAAAMRAASEASPPGRRPVLGE
jgi:hypothetical protein